MLRKSKKLSQVEFGAKIHRSDGTISLLEKDKLELSPILCDAICSTYNIRQEWLLKGKLPRDSGYEGIEVRPRIVSLHESIASPGENDLDEYVAVPLVEGKIAAGSGRVIREDIRSFVWVYRPEVGRRTNLVAVQIGPQEKSMSPTLTPGSILIIDRNDKTVTKKGIYAVRTNQDECAVKRVLVADGVILLCSDNLDYPPVVATISDLEQLIVGRVIWSWKSFVK
jgi:phage repressor protein C with HTH and peptisase S24 domain